jgi:hypothetical protein
LKVEKLKTLVLKFQPNLQIPDLRDESPFLDIDDIGGYVNDYSPSSPELHPESELQIKEEEGCPGQNSRVSFNLMAATI